MKNTKIGLTVEVGELKNAVSLELVPIDGEKCQPIIECKLSSGLETNVKLPPADYKTLNEKLARLAVSTDHRALESLARKIIGFLNL